MKPLEGQTALITGAVRRIGRATALELSQLGAAVVINSRSSRDEAEAVQQEIVNKVEEKIEETKTETNEQINDTKEKLKSIANKPQN